MSRKGQRDNSMRDSSIETSAEKPAEAEAKPAKFNERDGTHIPTEVVTPPVAKPEPKAKAPATGDVTPMLTFDRYFGHTKKPAHHKAGMLVWMKKQKNKKVKSTVAEWDALFSKY